MNTSTFPFALLIGLLLLGLGACSPPTPAERLNTLGQNIILISLDTTRSDYVSPWSEEFVKTPALKALAEDGYVFEEALTPVPMTLPAHASLFTGLHPISHQIRDNFNASLGKGADTVAERLRDAGYDTGAIIGSIILGKRTGLNQGFDFYDDEFSTEQYQAGELIVERVATEVTNRAIGWLQQRGPATAAPFFLFAHYYDPHVTYRPPEPFAETYADNLYAGEVAYMDDEVGRLLDYLRDQGLYDESLIIAFGDHGEGLGDHIEKTHGIFLYEETMHVPLIVKLPHTAQRSGERVGQLVSIMDIAPTLLELAGAGGLASDAHSLVPWLLNPQKSELRALVLETQYPLTFQWSPLFALRDPDWKYIHAPRAELYQLHQDPHERNNRLNRNGQQAKAMREELEFRMLDMARKADPSLSETMSEDRMKALSSLGYVGGPAAVQDPQIQSTLPDPKDKIDIYLKIDEGLERLSAGNVPEAMLLFHEVREADPHNPAVYVNLSIGYANLKDWPRALEMAQRAHEISPNHTLVRLQLSRLYLQNNQPQKAREILAELIAEHPTMADARLQMGRLEMMSQNPGGALKQFAKAEEIAPQLPGLQKMIEQAQEQQRLLNDEGISSATAEAIR